MFIIYHSPVNFIQRVVAVMNLKSFCIFSD